MEKISRFHFITQDIADFPHDQLARFACEGGAEWIQLRIKDKPFEAWVKYAGKTKEICDKYGARLIINDHVQIARQVGAYGVHLGQSDMFPNDARKILGENAIIGGTANNFDELQDHIRRGVDYVGLGPFRFTKTKLNLAPVLGLDGYAEVMEKCRQQGITVPVIAIGGINVEDIDAIMNTGVYGIAVSSAISLADDMIRESKRFLEGIAKYDKK
ncbi:MAG: thiamine phosphate synthase [Bacteroidota bacterium]